MPMQESNKILLTRVNCERLFLKPKGQKLFDYIDNGLGISISYDDHHAVRCIHDYSKVEFILEQVLTLGGSELLIIKSDINERAYKQFPQIVKNKIVLVDPQKAFEKSSVFLTPVADEFGIEFSNSAISYPNGLDKEIIEPFDSFSLELPSFFLALENKASVDIDLVNLKRLISELKAKIQSTEARIKLASLSGIIENYIPVNIHGIKYKWLGNPALSENFKEFIEDELYLQLARELYLVGFSERMRRAANLTSRIVKKIIRKPLFKPFFNIGSSTIFAATKVPIPSADEIFPLQAGDFLPPFIQFDKFYRTAREEWINKSASTIISQYVEIPNTNEGWIEVDLTNFQYCNLDLTQLI
jgi:hypothetical protein